MHRRTQLAATFGLSLSVLAALSLTACSGSTTPASGDEKTLVVYGPGGDLAAKYQKAFETFTSATGITVTYAEGVTSDNLAKIAAEKGNPQADIFLGTVEAYYGGEPQDLWAPLDTSIITNLDALPAVARVSGDKGLSPLMNLPILFYNTETFAQQGIPAPTTYADLFADPKLRGHIAFPDFANGYMSAYLAMRSQQLTGAPDDPKAAIDELLKNGLDWFYQFPKTPAEEAQMVASGEVWAGLDGSTRVADEISKGITVKPVIPESIAAIPTTYSAIKGGPHPAAAQQFLAWTVSAAGQEALQTQTGSNAVTDVPTTAAGVVTGDDLKKIFAIDYEKYIAAKPDWTAAWAAAIAG